MNKTELLHLYGREEVEQFFRDHWEVHNSKNEDEFQDLINRTMCLKDEVNISFPTEYFINGVPKTLHFEVESIVVHHNPQPCKEDNKGEK